MGSWMRMEVIVMVCVGGLALGVGLGGWLLLVALDMRFFLAWEHG